MAYCNYMLHENIHCYLTTLLSCKKKVVMLLAKNLCCKKACPRIKITVTITCERLISDLYRHPKVSLTTHNRESAIIITLSYRAGRCSPVCPVLAGPLIVKIFFVVCFSSQVILYTNILCCLYLQCNVQFIFHANRENVPKISYLGI